MTTTAQAAEAIRILVELGVPHDEAVRVVAKYAPDEIHMIAAARDLYASLIECLAIAERNEGGDYADRARAALAKARGERT